MEVVNGLRNPQLDQFLPRRKKAAPADVSGRGRGREGARRGAAARAPRGGTLVCMYTCVSRKHTRSLHTLSHTHTHTYTQVLSYYERERVTFLQFPIVDLGVPDMQQ